jgi:DNA-binding NarL/FixJ family response regulator
MLRCTVVVSIQNLTCCPVRLVYSQSCCGQIVMFADGGTTWSTSVASGRLAATGETVRKRTVETSTELTVQGAQIARLASEGLSNPEIGARLFLSARTVQYHLSKVFAKLGISARGQLHRVLPGDRAAVGPR